MNKNHLLKPSFGSIFEGTVGSTWFCSSISLTPKMARLTNVSTDVASLFLV